MKFYCNWNENLNIMHISFFIYWNIMHVFSTMLFRLMLHQIFIFFHSLYGSHHSFVGVRTYLSAVTTLQSTTNTDKVIKVRKFLKLISQVCINYYFKYHLIKNTMKNIKVLRDFFFQVVKKNFPLVGIFILHYCV